MINSDEYKFVDFDDDIVKKEAYDFILNSCDEVEFLSEYQVCFIDTLKDVYMPLYPQLENSLINIREDVSWGMNGKIFKFKLDDYLKDILRKIGLTNFLYLDDDKKYLLQNTTLIKNNQVIYSVCTHENFDEFDEEFESKLATICKDKLCNSNIYKELRDKNINKAPEELSKNIEILQDLCSYINREINASIYEMPKIESITFKNYIDIVNNTLSNTISTDIKNINSFKELISSNFTFTKELLGKTFNNTVNPFDDLAPLGHNILNECKYLYTILNFEF